MEAADDAKSIISLVVTHIEEDACTFWAQLYSPTIKMDLEKLSVMLEDHASSSMALHTDPLKEDVYGCPFMDGFWYRCRVLFAISNNKYLVQYIDYGNCEEKAKEYLVPLPQKFQLDSLKPMAQRFRLHNICIESESIKCAQNYIEEMCSNSFVKAKLISPLSAAPTEVILYDKDSYSVCDFLLESHMAIPADKMDTKKNITVTAPLTAQRYRNPLIVSSDESSEDANNNVLLKAYPSQGFFGSQSSGVESLHNESSGISSGGDAPAGGKFRGRLRGQQNHNVQTCKDCDRKKDEILKLKLTNKKIQHELLEAEQKVKNLIEKEEFWRIKYLSLKEQKSEIITMPSVQDGTNKEDDNSQQSPKNMKLEEAKRENVSAMKRIIFPALEFVKMLGSYNKVIDDCKKAEQGLKNIVEKINAHISSNRNLNDDNFLSLVALRNTLLMELKQCLVSVMPMLSVVKDENVKAQVKNFMTQLKKLANRGSLDEGTNEEMKVADMTKLIQAWKVKQEDQPSITTIINSMITCLSQQSTKLYASATFLSQVSSIQSKIEMYEGQEKLIEEVIEVGKGIKKMKQKVRILVTSMKNLEEDEGDSSDKEKEILRGEIDKTKKELSSCREDLQESFEKKWVLMDSLSDIVENFTPELDIEHPELGIDSYLNGKGIVMQGMELDHFDILSTRWDDHLHLEAFETTYRKQPIMLHKYLLHSFSKQDWSRLLEEIAVYSNIESPYATAPLGIYSEKDTAYVMISQHAAPGSLLSGIDIEDRDFWIKVVKQVAQAINELHQNGICHGQISTKSIVVVQSPKVLSSLLVPNFRMGPQERVKATVALDKVPLFACDVYHFGLLIKEVESKIDAEVLPDVAHFCLKCTNSSDYNIQSVLNLIK